MWLKSLEPGIISWVTRGINLGFHRNYFGLQVDDVFLPDSRWSATGHCTPGDGCVDPTVSTTDIRMTPADVAELVTGRRRTASPSTSPSTARAASGAGAPQRHGRPAHRLPAARRAGTSSAGSTTPTPTRSSAASRSRPPRSARTGAAPRRPTPPVSRTRRSRPTRPTTRPTTSSGCHRRGSAPTITQNVAWATTAKLPNFDPTVLVTGEHSGLTSAPQQPIDNPNLARRAHGGRDRRHGIGRLSRDRAAHRRDHADPAPAPDEHLLQRGHVPGRGQPVQLDLRAVHHARTRTTPRTPAATARTRR